MLHRDPNKRPHINQIISQPKIINHIMYLYTDWGKIPSIRIQRPLSSMQPTSRCRQSAQVCNLSSRDNLPEKPQTLTSVFCWGSGITLPIKLPFPSSETQVIQVATGRTQKAAVTKNGRLFVWESVCIGTDNLLSNSLDHNIPAFVSRYLEGQAAVTIQHVACGDLFVACLTDRGILMTFGSGANGCLGHGNYNDITQAKIVEALLGYEVSHVSCGASHVLAVTNEHEVFAWGRGDNGRLGLATEESCASPCSVPVPENIQPYSVHCGMDSSIILTLDKEILCCGNNRYNKLGIDLNGNCIDEVSEFTLITVPPLGDKEIKNVALGTSHTIVATVSGQCYTFGSNQFGQLGYESDPNERGQPHCVMALQSYCVSAVGCGDTYSVAVTEDNKVFTWGNSSRGRLGRAIEKVNVPERVNFYNEEPFCVTSISCSYGNTLIATKSIST